MAAKRRPSKDFHDLTGMRVALYCRVSSIKGRSGDQATDEKSVNDQEREGRAWVERTGLNLREEHVLRDPGLSASRFATKDRPEFKRMLELVKADQVDVVWIWAIDRSNRDLRVFADMRDLFMKHQVALSVNGRIHDPANYDDWMLLGFTSIFGERYTEELSKNVRRGRDAIADDGRPPAKAPFGYRRRRSDNRPDGVPDERVWYSAKYKQWVWQEPDLWDGDGRPVENTPAWVVREIFQRVAAGDGLMRIARDLTDRGVEMPRGGKPTPRHGWHATQIKHIALNPTYISRLVQHADWSAGSVRAHEAIRDDVTAKWPPLVDEDMFWRAHRILTDPARRHTRPHRATSLLSFVVTCAKCGGPVGMHGRGNTRRADSPLMYGCVHRGCASINRDKLDDYVEEVMIRWLSDPDVFAALSKVDDSAAGAHARAEANQARAELDMLYRDVKAGRVSRRMAEADESRLLAVIIEADKLAQQSAMPPALVGRIGDEAEAAWKAADDAVKRQMIQAVADIRLKPTDPAGRGARRSARLTKLAEVAERAGVATATASQIIIGRGGYAPATQERVVTAARELGYIPPGWQHVPVEQRVEWRWLLGPDAEEEGGRP